MDIIDFDLLCNVYAVAGISTFMLSIVVHMCSPVFTCIV